jgi:hypothetical protein
VDNHIGLSPIESPVQSPAVADIHLVAAQGQNTVARAKVGYEIPAQHAFAACYQNSQGVFILNFGFRISDSRENSMHDL